MIVSSVGNNSYIDLEPKHIDKTDAKTEATPSLYPLIKDEVGQKTVD